MWPSQRLASIGLDSRQRKSRARSRDRRGIRPIVTLLEERTLLSTLNLTVTTLQDDPTTPIVRQVTLRDAIGQANADTTDSQEIIGFASGLAGKIDLTTALPALSNNISINGPGASNLTVQRDSNAAQFSVFTVNGSEAVSISGITITGGDNYGIGGGGIANSGILTVTNDTFTNNYSNDFGGSIYNIGTLTVIHSDFTGNSAGTAGGGIYTGIDPIAQTTVGTATVTSSTFTNNSGSTGGGIYNTGPLTVTNDTFTNNSAPQGGGGIENNGHATVAVIDSTFTGNSAADVGGGIDNFGTATVTNSTFTGNSAGVGGGIENDILLTLNNTIVAGNVAGNVNADVSGTVQPASENNLIGDGTGITNLNQLAPSNLIGTTADLINPMLGPLANNGGPTQTMALLPGSPAIDAGSNALIPAGVTTDQRGAGYPESSTGPWTSVPSSRVDSPSPSHREAASQQAHSQSSPPRWSRRSPQTTRSNPWQGAWSHSPRRRAGRRRPLVEARRLSAPSARRASLPRPTASSVATPSRPRPAASRPPRASA